MNLITNSPRGTADVLPSGSTKWQYIEKVLRDVASKFLFSEIRFPTFEHSELFLRGVGEGTDIVSKEMYSFLDKGDRDITLRPEGTASAMRLIMQNGLYANALPLKLFYIISCFRYEKPQAGRLREFHQFGAEIYGSNSPSSDAFIISFADSVLKAFELSNISLELNYIGCSSCRPVFTNILKEYFENKKDLLCKTCNDRLHKNPLRILDCKCPECVKIAKDAPKTIEHLCCECNDYFEKVCELLNSAKVYYTINSKIVRGLDYYNGVVFEFVSDEIGAQGTVCGGGRYDGLSMQISDTQVSGIGFAMGLERLIMLLEKQGKMKDKKTECLLYIAPIGEMAEKKALSLAKNIITKLSVPVEIDLLSRSIKAQMKYANKLGCKYVLVIGDDELSNGYGTIKNMETSVQEKIKFEEIEDYLKGELRIC